MLMEYDLLFAVIVVVVVVDAPARNDCDIEEEEEVPPRKLHRKTLPLGSRTCPLVLPDGPTVGLRDEMILRVLLFGGAARHG